MARVDFGGSDSAGKDAPDDDEQQPDSEDKSSDNETTTVTVQNARQASDVANDVRSQASDDVQSTVIDGSDATGRETVSNARARPSPEQQARDQQQQSTEQFGDLSGDAKELERKIDSALFGVAQRLREEGQTFEQQKQEDAETQTGGRPGNIGPAGTSRIAAQLGEGASNIAAGITQLPSVAIEAGETVGFLADGLPITGGSRQETADRASKVGSAAVAAGAAAVNQAREEPVDFVTEVALGAALSGGASLAAKGSRFSTAARAGRIASARKAVDQVTDAGRQTSITVSKTNRVGAGMGAFDVDVDTPDQSRGGDSSINRGADSQAFEDIRDDSLTQAQDQLRDQARRERDVESELVADANSRQTGPDSRPASERATMDPDATPDTSRSRGGSQRDAGQDASIMVEARRRAEQNRNTDLEQIDATTQSDFIGDTTTTANAVVGGAGVAFADLEAAADVVAEDTTTGDAADTPPASDTPAATPDTDTLTFTDTGSDTNTQPDDTTDTDQRQNPPDQDTPNRTPENRRTADPTPEITRRPDTDRQRRPERRPDPDPNRRRRRRRADDDDESNLDSLLDSFSGGEFSREFDNPVTDPSEIDDRLDELLGDSP